MLDDLRCRLQAAIRADGGRLLKARFAGVNHPLAGYCYIAAEAAYHLLGGEDSAWVPARTEGVDPTHWWLEHPDGRRFDPTKEQYAGNPPYDAGRRAGFLTVDPCLRTQQLLNTLPPKAERPDR